MCLSGCNPNQGFFEEFFFHSGSPSGTLHSKKFQKTLILAFEANSALSSQNGLFSVFYLIVQNVLIKLTSSYMSSLWAALQGCGPNFFLYIVSQYFFGQSALAHPTINEIDNDFGKIFTRIADIGVVNWSFLLIRTLSQ